MSIPVYKVYRHLNLLNNKSYIGLTSQTIHERFLAHIAVSKTLSQTKFSRALRKYSSDSWEHIELCSTTKTELALILEKFYIEYYDSYKNGYNSNPGGVGVLFHSKETRQKMSRPGAKNPMFGRSRPDLVLRNLTNNPAKSTEARKKISNSMKEASPNRGKPAWNTGIKMAPRKTLMPLIQCPHCLKTGGRNIMTRWHFNNCKSCPIL